MYPRTVYTDVNGVFCKTDLAVQLSGVANQRITSVAWKRSVGGIVRPSAWAVLRLITSSKFMGGSMGRSAGFAAFKIRST